MPENFKNARIFISCGTKLQPRRYESVDTSIGLTFDLEPGETVEQARQRVWKVLRRSFREQVRANHRAAGFRPPNKLLDE